jgi:alkylation response protein AidB-like acyl-CoA dehydrogenase
MASTEADSTTLAEPMTDADRLLADVRAFVTGEVLPNVAEWDRDDVLPPAAFARLVDIGLMGALVPTRYGGPGLTVAELVPVWRTLSQGWISLTGAVNPSGLATALLLGHGTEAQRERWLRPLAAGEIFAAFSITEPQAGSDLQRLQTHGAPNPGGGLTLNGSKRWVAGGESCDVVFMLAAVDGAQRPSCVVLPTDGRGGPGWSVASIDKLGYRGVESAAYEFDGFTAAEAEILGGEAGLGHGARQMLGALDVGRVNVACRALGILDRVAAVGATQALEREVGETVLADYTHTQLRIGELHARMLAAESLTHRAAAAVDAGASDARQLAGAAKIICSDLAVSAIDQIARLAASHTYGAEDELARLRRDAPQTQIGEGANDALVFALAREVLGVWESDAASPAWAPGHSDGAAPG